MAGEPIVVVDDNPTNSKLLQVVLGAEGYDVRVAADGRELGALLARFRPELIVVVAVSAYAMNADREHALASGCDGYLAKPIDTRKLPGIVAGYLSRGREA